MKFYIDFDDCLCETAAAFVGIAKRLFKKDVPYENVRFFNLKESFSLTDEEYEQLMTEGHRSQVLLSYDETPGASEVVNEWIDQGHEISVITGRPFSSFEFSRRWLDEHGLERVSLFCLDKYGRDTFIKGSSFNLELDEYYRMKFDFAIEDSPMAFSFFDHLPDLKIMVYDRPWNHETEFPDQRFTRCQSWEQIRKQVDMLTVK